MPLSKKRNRERMREKRATQVQPKAVQPDEPTLETKLSKAGLKVGKGGKLDLTGLTTRPLKEDVNGNVPMYDRTVHVPGDKVMVKRAGRLIETTVPDADGQVIPDM